MSGYFQHFPLFNYSNTTCIDITRRCRVMNSVRSNPFSYYPYTVKDGQRADFIASKYYYDQMRSWMVYASMDIVDPYYEYPLSDEQFKSYITDKYGSTSNAQNKVFYWEINWSDEDGSLTTSGFNSLPDPLKKYYNANFGIGANILSYSRRKVDWLTTTNMIVTYDVEASNSFTSGELIQITSNNAVVGNAEVAWSNTTMVITKNIFGASPTSNATMIGLTSNVTATITGREYTANCIAEDERTFWEPVTFWDHEITKHEGKKYINLIDQKYTTQMEAEFDALINDKPLLYRSF